MLISTDYPCEKILYSLTQNWDKRLLEQWSLNFLILFLMANFNLEMGN